MSRSFAFEDRRLAAVSGLADDGIELDVPEERDSELLGRLLRPAARKDIDFVTAVRADEVTHVFYHAHQIDLHLAEHFDGFASVLQRNIRRRRNHNRSGERNGLNQRKGNVSSARRQIHDQIIELSPLYRAEKLLDD